MKPTNTIKAKSAPPNPNNLWTKAKGLSGRLKRVFSRSQRPVDKRNAAGASGAPVVPLTRKQRWLRRGRKWLKRTAIFFLGLFLLFFLLNLLFPLPREVDYSTLVTDNKGEVIFASLTADQKWRMKTELNEISPLLQNTIIQKEDKYFFSHPGVNPFAIIKSGFKNIIRWKRVSGASTITMQVARMLEKRPRNLWSKMVECFRAFQLEWKYSKKKILQMYLNMAPYGGNIEGVKSASVIYFNKMPDHLSLAEITALSIIPNRPVSLVPGKNNDLIVEERNRWLRKFARDDYFTKKQIEDALNEPLTAVRRPVPFHAPHLAYKLRRGLGTENIHTHIDLNTQLKTEQMVYDYVHSLYLKNIHNGSVIIIDNETHKVITYVGSADFKDTADAGQVNGAMAIRQPGSTLKPLLYGLSIDEGYLTPKRIMNDVSTNFGGGYMPENYDKKFNGYVTLEFALDHSLNIPAVKALQQLGVEKLVQKLSDCQFRQVQKDRNKLGLSMILGGCGASLEELTGLYSSFAANGNFIQPSYCTQDTMGRSVRVMSPEANFMIAEMLSKVNRPDFPLSWESSVHLPRIAWKTGTSYGRRDAWSIGFNKKYTVGVWLGNFNGEGAPDLSGANIATPLLFRIFNTINYDADQEWFRPPVTLQQRKICTVTGMPVNEFCTDQALDYFIPLHSSNELCNHMQEVQVDEKESISYCKTCLPSSGYKTKWYRITPFEMQRYFDENHIAYDKVPPHNPQCERVFTEGAPVITSPRNGNEYYISKDDPEPLQLSCETGTDVSRVYWYINNKLYKTAQPKEKIFFAPAEGPVKISCADDKGRNQNIWITVKKVAL